MTYGNHNHHQKDALNGFEVSFENVDFNNHSSDNVVAASINRAVASASQRMSQNHRQHGNHLPAPTTTTRTVISNGRGATATVVSTNNSPHSSQRHLKSTTGAAATATTSTNISPTTSISSPSPPPPPPPPAAAAAAAAAVSGMNAANAPPVTGPIDIDNYIFDDGDDDDDDDQESQQLFGDENHKYDEYDEDPFLLVEKLKYFHNPNQRLLDNDASLIPGSPFSKPRNKISSRPTEPLSIAKYVSTLAFIVTLGWVGYLFFLAIETYDSPGRIVFEIILAIISFFGLFWNTYFIIASIGKCFIPSRAFRTNTKYCSIIPETKPPEASWMDVTIQIPVYKESLREVLMPTLKSCMKARDFYHKNTSNVVVGAYKAKCNIVVCDDGMMAFLRDNFAAAEMLWDAIIKTHGRVVKLSKLLKTVDATSRRHLKGMRSKNVYEVFWRMLYYYHHDIGFVARSTVDRRGKFKKASNLNSHLQLALGAAQLVERNNPNKNMTSSNNSNNDDDSNNSNKISFQEALLQESHNANGSRYVMFGNDISIGHLICVNDADARMSPSVIFKTVPEFLNDAGLGFTQHTTKTMTEQRGESYYTNLLAVYTDALYQGHFLLSSIMGCHPPLVGHSIFLRTEAVKQCGRMRMLRHAQRWLRNIGLPFLPVDQVGFSNLQANNRAEYWSESHVSEDFELMIHLYNLGFNGRYCAYPDCEFEEGITRTFDEEAGRHRKFSLGAHELVFNPLQEWFGHGIFTPLFRTFIACDIPAYYKVFLTAYLCSYSSGGAYIIVFTLAAAARLIDAEEAVHSLYTFSPAGIIILNIIAFYVIGYITFLFALLRMHYVNNKLLFPEYRKKCCGALYIIFVEVRYCLVFQFLFYTVASITYYFLGSMDHLLSRPNICSATNKDSIEMSRCTAFYYMASFNIGSWFIALFFGGLAYATVLEAENWDYTSIPTTDEFIYHALFAGPPIFLALMTFISPIILNPYILGWPFLWKKKPAKKAVRRQSSVKKDALGRVVNLSSFMDAAKQLDSEIERVEGRPDVEVGTVRDLFSHDGTSPSTTGGKRYVHPSLLGGRQVSNGTSSNSDVMNLRSIAEAPPQRTSKPHRGGKHHTQQHYGV